MNKQGTDQSVQMQMMICAMHNSKAKTRFAHDKVYIRTLWSYHYGNLGFITYSGVKVNFSSCSISSFNHR